MYGLGGCRNNACRNKTVCAISCTCCPDLVETAVGEQQEVNGTTARRLEQQFSRKVDHHFKKDMKALEPFILGGKHATNGYGVHIKP